MDDSDENSDLSEMRARIRQLEDASREAHVHLRDKLAEGNTHREIQQCEIEELREELSDARQHIRRLEQQLIAPGDGDSD